MLGWKFSESGSLCGFAFVVQDSLNFIVDSRGRQVSDFLTALPNSLENEPGGMA